MRRIRPLLRSVRPDDAVYFQSRAVQEKAAARAAKCAAARARHDGLAALYQIRAAMVASEPAADRHHWRG